MADELYRSYSLEKSKNDDGEIITSGSMTVWEDTPDFPLRIGEHFRPVSNSPLLTVNKLSVKDNVVGTLNGKPVRQWQITIEGKNGEQDGSQTENNVKYTFIIADNKKSGTMEVVNTGSSPSLRLEVGDTFAVPGIGNVRCTKITGNDEYTESGTRKWTTVYEWTDGNGESDTKYNFSIERSGDNTISTGSKTVTNSGNSPSNVALAETITVPGVGALPCVKVSGRDDYDENGNHVWTVTYDGSNAPNATQETHDTKYNISIEKNGNDDPITSGSKTVTNSGDTPSDLEFVENLSLPGVGDIPLVKVSASDDYDDDGNHVWTVTHEGSNEPDTTQVEHDTKYNISIERNNDNELITSGSKTVTNSGDTPSNLVLAETVNLPGVGDIPMVKVSASDDYDDNGTRKWTVTYDATNEPSEQGQTTHDTKYNISIERNSDNQPITSGSKTVTNSGDTPSNLVLDETVNLPGVGDIPLVKVSASDDYDENGNHVWTVTHEGSNEPEITQETHDTKYNISIEKNGNDDPITSGSKTVTNSGDTPSDLEFVENLSLPGVGDIPLVKVSASDDYDDDGNHVWTVTHEGSNEPDTTQTEHNTKYNISIERNSDNQPITSGSKTVTNSGDTPSNLVLDETVNLPGVGDIPLVKVSASDDYDDNGNHVWTVTHEGSNEPEITQETHDTRYNYSIEKNANDEPIATGTKTVTNSGDTPSNVVLSNTINLPGVGDVRCTRVSASDDYNDDGSHVWTVTYDGTNEPIPDEQEQTAHNTKYNISIEKNDNNELVTSGSKTVTNSGDTPSDLEFAENLNLPGVGNIPLVKVSASDDYDDDGTRKWIVTHEGSNALTPAEQEGHDTKYSLSIERNGNDEPIITGSKTVTNSGDSPSNLALTETVNLPGIGDIKCTKVSANDSYDDDGTHTWTVTYDASNASDPETQTEHDTKYNFSVERNSDNETVITGSKTVTNSGSSPSSVTLPAKLNLPSIGDINCVKLSGNDDYDDDGTRKWTVTYEGSNAASTATQGTHDTKYNFSIERNGDNDTIITGSKTVTNSGSNPSSATLPANVNLPGIGNLRCVKVSGSDDYDDDGTHVWTVNYDGSNAPVTTQTEHDTKYNFSIENSNNEVVKTGSKTVIISGDTLPNLSVGETINVPGIGNVKCIKVSGNDDYDDSGTRKWTVVYDCTDAPQEQTTSSNVRYSINIERNSDGVVVYTGTKEITSDNEPTTSTNIGDKLTFPLIGSVPCVRVYSNNNDNGTWTLTIECSSESESGSGEGGGEGGTSTLLPETETETTYEINGTTARSVAGELIILKRSDTSITKQTVTVYTQDGNSVANPGSSYRGGTCISEHISQETIKNNGVVVSSYYKHVIEVEA